MGNGEFMDAPRFSPYRAYVFKARFLKTTARPKRSYSLKHHTRIDAAKPKGIAQDVAERLFARLVRHDIDVASGIRSFEI